MMTYKQELKRQRLITNCEITYKTWQQSLDDKCKRKAFEAWQKACKIADNYNPL